MKKETTKQKLQNLIRDLVAEHGEGSIVNTKTVYEKAKSSDKYCTYYMLSANPVYKIGRGKVLLTTKNNVEELKKNLQAETEKQKSKQLPEDVRKSAVKLAKTLMENTTVGKFPKKTVLKDTQKLGRGNRESKKTVITNYSPDDYLVTQDDINDSFGGNDINDILASL